jgi:hypothetical protein
VRNASLWRAVLGVENTVVEDVEFGDEAQVVVAHVRPRRAGRGRCGICGAKASWYDRGEGRRRWRGLDLGTLQVFLEADARASTAPITGRRYVRSPGRDTAPDTPAPLTNRWPGWPRSAPRVRSPS